MSKTATTLTFTLERLCLYVAAPSEANRFELREAQRAVMGGRGRELMGAKKYGGKVIKPARKLPIDRKVFLKIKKHVRRRARKKVG